MTRISEIHRTRLYHIKDANIYLKHSVILNEGIFKVTYTEWIDSYIQRCLFFDKKADWKIDSQHVYYDKLQQNNLSFAHDKEILAVSLINVNNVYRKWSIFCKQLLVIYTHNKLKIVYI